VIAVGAVDVLVVQVVDVVIVAYLHVSAVLAVLVIMGFGGHVVCGYALVVVRLASSGRPRSGRSHVLPHWQPFWCVCF